MSSSFGGLGIGISALFAQQKALDVTGQNISNVNTPGYARQSVTHVASPSVNMGYSRIGKPMQAGTGVDVQQIKQSVDEFLDIKLRRENKELGYWTTRQGGLEELQTIFNDNSEDGLQTVMNNFWNSWSQLSKPGGGLIARAQVKESAIAFIETVKNSDKLLDNFRKNKDQEIKDNVDRINAIAKRVAELNYSIKQVESGRAHANDYRDERSKLINELSTIANVQVIGDTTVNIALEGRLLVADNSAEELVALPDPNNSGCSEIRWKNTMEKLQVSGGAIKSLMETRDELVFGFKERLNEFVKGVAQEINNLHHAGYGNLDNTQRFMFINPLTNDDTDVNVGNITFNPELIDTNNIAASLNPPPGNFEDGRNAIKINELRLKDIFSDTKYEATDPTNRKYNFDEYYRNLITDLGVEGNKAASAADAQQTLVNQVENRRQGVMSVSLDEEMTNLIRYEHSYNAASRVVNAMDEMLEIIVNKIGVGGR